MKSLQEIKVCLYRESVCQNLDELTRLRELEKTWKKVVAYEKTRWLSSEQAFMTKEEIEHLRNLKELSK